MHKSVKYAYRSTFILSGPKPDAEIDLCLKSAEARKA